MTAHTLIIDTAFDTCQVALAVDDKIIAQQRAHGGGQHDRMLATMVQDLLRAEHTDIKALEKILVSTGPGRFTGLRVGVAFARGLRLVHKTPLIGVNSMDALLLDMAPHVAAGEAAAAIVTVKRGESFVRLVGHDVIDRIEDIDLERFLSEKGLMKIAGVLSPAVQDIIKGIEGVTILPVTEPSLTALLAAAFSGGPSATDQDVVRPYYAPSYVSSEAS